MAHGLQPYPVGKPGLVPFPAHGTLIVLVIVPVKPPPSVTLRVMVLEPPVENVKVIAFVLPMMTPLARFHSKATTPTSSVELLASKVQVWLGFAAPADPTPRGPVAG